MTEEREARLRALFLAAKDCTPTGVDSRFLIGRASERWGISARTVREYLDDLQLRGVLELRVGIYHVGPRGLQGLDDPPVSDSPLTSETLTAPDRAEGESSSMMGEGPTGRTVADPGAPAARGPAPKAPSGRA